MHQLSNKGSSLYKCFGRITLFSKTVPFMEVMEEKLVKM